jgi:hypothetical protein
MPLASLIGSGMGILNPWNLQLVIDRVKVPVLVDAGVGTASDAAIAMELGCDGVLMNTAIAAAKDPVRMARAMRQAVEAGRDAFLAGRMPKKALLGNALLADRRRDRRFSAESGLSAPIRSYVLRQSRTTPAQRRALEELFPKYGLPFAASPIDPQRIFGRRAPLVLEIGSGMGETTIEIARAHPATDFIAIEVHGPGVGSLLKQIAAGELSNLRVIRHDAVEVLERMIPDGALAAIHLFFPRPLAEEAPSQAAPRAAGRSRRLRAASSSAAVPSCRYRLA